MKPGDSLDGRYTIVGRLGEGGMGEIYKATHDYLGATRVIKVVRPQISGSEDARDRFLREARAAIKVRHANVATLHDFASLPDGAHYMVWEYIEGENLAQRLRSRGVMQPLEAVDVIVRALRGLEAIHRAGIVHRDISPENIMITPEGDVKIIDLGVAKVDDPGAVSQTRTGIFVGKLRYASPEQMGFLDEGEKIDGRTDLYAVGMVLVELLTGRPPYEAKSPHEYFLLHARDEHKKTVDLPSPFPGGEGLRAVAARALARDRDDRFATAHEFANALEATIPSLPAPDPLRTMAIPSGASAVTEVSTDRDLSYGTVRAHGSEATVRTAVDEETVRTLATETTAPAVPLSTVAAPPPPALPTAPAQPLPPDAAPRRRSSALVVSLLLTLLVLAGAFVGWRYFAASPAAAPPLQQPTATTATTASVPPTPSGTDVTVVPDESAGEQEAAAATGDVESTETRQPVRNWRVIPADAGSAGADSTSATTTEASDAQPSGPTPVYVDGGEDDDANDRALELLRKEVRGTNEITLQAGVMQNVVAAALRESLPDLELVDDADVVVRFQGKLDRLRFGRKRRGAEAWVFKKGRPVFHYVLPEEVFRVGMAPPDAFARIFADAVGE